MALRPYGKNDVYMRNAGIVKMYDDNHFKLIQMRALRLEGFEERGISGKGKKGSAGNPAKLNESLSRSRSKVFELALANPWEYFVTLTLDGKKFDRYSLDKTYKTFAKWINNLNYGRKVKIKYLIIPELHADGAWHFHCLIMGLLESDLAIFDSTKKLPKYIRDKISLGEPIYNWPRYAEKFGFVVAEPIKSHEACAVYMTKYITKSLLHSGVELNHHIFYPSKGLRKAEKIHIGEMRQNLEEPDYENDYVRVKNFATLEEAMKYFYEKE